MIYQRTITQGADESWEAENFIKIPSKNDCFCYFFFMKSKTSTPFVYLIILKYLNKTFTYVKIRKMNEAFVAFCRRRRRSIYLYILNLLSAHMNVPNAKFSGNSIKHLDQNASTFCGR